MTGTSYNHFNQKDSLWHQTWIDNQGGSLYIHGDVKDDVMTMIDKYLDYAIQYDYPFNIVKYCVQQLLGSMQDSDLGRNFLNSATMQDLCNVFDQG